MRVVSVINYKGGVGKTTLTANLGAYLAQRGNRVLLIDLDPQCSLTVSFFAPDNTAGFPSNRTLMTWFESFVEARPQRELSEFVAIPSRVNETVASRGGFVGIIPSSLRLIDADMALLIEAGMQGVASDHYIYKVRRALSDALAYPALGSYDYVLIDCPPNFNVITQSAIVASDHFLIPASPDYLSTLGTAALLTSVNRFVDTYNRQATEYSVRPDDTIAPTPLGLVFTMVEYRNGRPITSQEYFMEQARRHIGAVPVFAAAVRDNAAFGKENPNGVPLILRLRAADQISIELDALATEFLNCIKTGTNRRAVA